MAASVRVGIGGWVFPPWRGVFYPKGTRQADELAFASRRLTAIEINGTYHSLQAPETFAKWAAETPPGFIFTVKASRLCTNRRVLADAGAAIERFFAQGVGELGDRLGPILWQFMPTKAFAREDFAAFLGLLPEKVNDRRLRHCVEVRHPSFEDAAFVDLCRGHGVAICLADHPSYPMIAETTADFAYVRLMRGADEIETGYAPAALDVWAGRLNALAAPDRDVFAFFISAGKVRAPAAAMALIERL
jgi:uncharacterized protein YecE (DUF72 family)